MAEQTNASAVDEKKRRVFARVLARVATALLLTTLYGKQRPRDDVAQGATSPINFRKRNSRS